MKNIVLKSALGGALIFACCAVSAKAPEPKSFNVWPEGKMPGTAAAAETMKGTHITAVAVPELKLYRANSDKPSGLVIICPGGGYTLLAYDHEGEQVARWLNDNKISAAILKYRVPANPDGALQDIQRAVRLARANAKDWNISPDKIAVLGFSAGANLCARASAPCEGKTYESADSADEFSARPNLTCLVYPAYCDNPGNEKRWNKTAPDKDADYNALYALASNLKIDKDTPPVFIIQSQNDRSYVNGAIAYFLAMKRAGVPSQLHIFDSGGHGYGLADGRDHINDLCREWPQLAANWFKHYKFSTED